MSERPRMTLRLKNPPPMPQKSVRRWKCKPCGAAVEVGAALADEDDVRCPACRAKLGRAAQFRRASDADRNAVRARAV